MSMTNINIRVEDAVKQQAQEIFSSLGLDMSTAINVFLRQAIRHRGIPFSVVEQATQTPANPQHLSRQKPHLGGWEGQIWIADDFDAPLEEFAEYIQ